MDSFSYKEAANFDKAMSNFTTQIAVAVTAVYDFSTFRTVVDVGGGNGSLLAGILRANPSLRGIVFEQPPVAARAKEHVRDNGLAEQGGRWRLLP